MKKLFVILLSLMMVGTLSAEVLELAKHPVVDEGIQTQYFATSFMCRVVVDDAYMPYEDYIALCKKSWHLLGTVDFGNWNYASSKDEVNEARADLKELFEQTGKEYARVHYWDSVDVICHIGDGNIIVYTFTY